MATYTAPSPTSAAAPEAKAATQGELASPLEVMKFSDAVQSAIDEVTPPTEAMDRRDFVPVAYINEMFPTEASLVGLDDAIAKLSLKVRRLDDDIVAAVRSQVDAGEKGGKELAQAKGSVKELFAKINDIKDKAEASERMVTEICRHIKSLDHGKRNLTIAINTLKKLQMLSSGVEQLGTMLKKGKYGDAAKKLEAVTQLSANFAAFGSVKKIRELNEAIGKHREESVRLVYEEFRAVFDKKRPAAGLADVCDLVTALGEEKRKQFVQWFCDTRFDEYKNHFNPYAESSKLDFVEKRYTWFHSALQQFGETYADVFPSEWAMAEKFSEEFCCVTRLALMELLTTTRSTLNVTALVMALQRTIEFEQGLMNLFEPDNGDDDRDPHDDESPAPGEDGDKDKAKVEIAPPPKKFKGIISTVFDPYMELYVDQEDRNVKEMLERTLKDEQWTVDEDASNKVLGSCVDLIFYMKTSLKRCLELSTGQPLYDLHVVFRKHIRAYTQALAAHLPGDKAAATEKDLKITCLIVNTGEFARSRCEQFQRAFTKPIAPKLKDKVDFKPEMGELKQNITSRGVNLLAAMMCQKLEPSLSELSKMPWATIDSVTDTSPYVAVIQNTLEADIPVIRKWLTDCPGITAKHWPLFMDVFVTRFAGVHLDAIYRCKRIGDIGAQGLLLNTTALRGTLVNLPVLGTAEANIVIPVDDAGTSVPSVQPQASSGPGSDSRKRFTKFVDSALQKTQAILKVLLAPQETIAHTYAAFMSTTAGGSLEGFQKIIELRGFSKGERQTLIDQFQQATAAAQRPPPGATAAASAASTPASSSANAAAPPAPGASVSPSVSSGSGTGVGATPGEIKAKTKAIFGKMLDSLHTSSNPQ